MLATKTKDIPTLMPIILLAVYGVLYLKLGLVTSLEIMAIVSTLNAVGVGIIKWINKPKRDILKKFHGSNGRYISKTSGYYGYGTAICAIILPISIKPDLIFNALPIFTNLPTEMQVGYVLASHVIGFGLSR